jgi:DNA-binding response OmpR family regulator/DNA-binding SARP family transcriptional activator
MPTPNYPNPPNMTEQTVRILILEDDEQLRSVLKQVLESEGYEVTVSGAADGAIQAARESAYDLVVADIRMEGKDGLEALETIKHDQPDVRSLVITGYSTEADSIRAIRLGVNDYLTKPFRLDKFLDSINAIVARRRLELATQAERDHMRQNLLWLSRLAASFSDRERESQPLLELDRRAQQLVQNLALGAASSAQVRLATLWTALQNEPEYEKVEARPAPPPGVERIISALQERWDGEGAPVGLKGRAIPIEARAVSVLLGVHRQDLNQDGRYDPEILRALEQGHTPAKKGEELLPAQRRGLLSLARALEQAGQEEQAQEAYTSVCEAGGLSQENAEALLGLARLCQQPEKAEEATDMARSLGPTVLGRIAFKAAHAHPDHARSLKWLKLAGSTYRALGDTRGQAVTVLAMDARTGTVEKTLLKRSIAAVLQPENRALLVESANWLCPYLLGQDELDAAQNRLLSRILWDAPGAIGIQLRSGSLNSEQRQRLVVGLTQAGHHPPKLLTKLLLEDEDAEVRQQAQSLTRSDATPSNLPFLRARSMGPFELYRADQRVQEGDWKTRKVKFLAAWMLLKGDSALGEDQVLDQFWPDEMEKGKQSLYWATSAVRRLLKGQAEGQMDPVLRNLGTIGLNPDLPRWHDVEELEKLLKQARRQIGQKELSLDRFRPILELYRGPYLEECYMDWAAGIRTRLAQETVAVLEELANRAAAAADHESAGEFAGKVTEIEPCHQSAHALAMRAWLGLGRPERVVRQFESTEQTLKLELDVEPSIELVELYHRAKLML